MAVGLFSFGIALVGASRVVGRWLWIGIGLAEGWGFVWVAPRMVGCGECRGEEGGRWGFEGLAGCCFCLGRMGLCGGNRRGRHRGEMGMK